MDLRNENELEMNEQTLKYWNKFWQGKVAP